jgi:cell division protein FtsQ
MQKNDNKSYRRRKRGVLAGLFMVLLLAFAVVLTSTLFFRIKEIRVEGDTVVSKTDVIQLSGFSQGDNILLINKTAAQRSIVSRLSYVKAVRIKRELPGRVVIAVTEARPAAAVEHRDKLWIIDEYGSLLEAVPVRRSNLPGVIGFSLSDPVEGTRVYADEDDETKIEPLLELLQVMVYTGIIDDVGEIDLSKLSNITFTYKEKYSVELGTPEGFLKKLEMMVESLKNGNVAAAGPGTFKFGEGSDRSGSFIPSNR